MATATGISMMADGGRMTTVKISIPDAMSEWLDERIRSGQYADASDYVSDLIRQDRERREALVRALIEGEESGESERSVRQIVADTKSKIGNGTI
jgi:antitoxin ParD1/3/4